MLTILYFYESISMDVDNITKPISDAFIDLVYMDDDQITDCVVRKRNLAGNFRIENPSVILAEGFGRGVEFLYILIEEAPDQEIIT